MKKMIIVLLFVLTLASVEMTAAGKSVFGLKIGADSASLTNNIFIKSTWERYMGFTAGVFFSLALTDNLDVQPELLIVQKGIHGKGLNVDQGVILIFRFNYLEIPLLFRYSFSGGEGRAPRPYILAGPYLGFKLSAKETLEYSNETVAKKDVEIKNTDFGLTAGVGLSIPIGSGAALAEIRYSHGFSEVFKGSEMNNNVWTAMIGYQF